MAAAEKKLPFPAHGDCQGFTGVVLDQLRKLGMPGMERHYDRGDYIWMPGEQSDRIFFLRRGQVALLSEDPEGRQIILRVVDAGEPFGELCFCEAHGGTRSETARAVLDCDLLVLSYDDFVQLLQHNGDALSALLFMFCGRVRDLQRRVEMLSYRGAEDRLGRLLLLLSMSRGLPIGDNSARKEIDASHDELALTAAMSRSHVTVTMGRFRRNGLVEYSRGRPLVVNVRALESYLDDDFSV